MQKPHLKPSPPAEKCRPSTGLNPVSTPTNNRPKPRRIEGSYEDGTRCIFYLDEHGNEVTSEGDPISYDDDDFDCCDDRDSENSFVPVERRQTKKVMAADLLRKWLRNGPVAVAELKRRAEAANLSWSTLDKARYELGLFAIKGNGKGGGWLWQLPN